MTPEQVQELITRLDLDRYDFIVEAVLVARVKDMESGAVGLSLAATDDTDWVTQLGLLRGAEIITTRELRRSLED